MTKARNRLAPKKVEQLTLIKENGMILKNLKGSYNLREDKCVTMNTFDVQVDTESSPMIDDSSDSDQESDYYASDESDSDFDL